MQQLIRNIPKFHKAVMVSDSTSAIQAITNQTNNTSSTVKQHKTSIYILGSLGKSITPYNGQQHTVTSKGMRKLTNLKKEEEKKSNLNRTTQ